MSHQAPLLGKVVALAAAATLGLSGLAFGSVAFAAPADGAIPEVSSTTEPPAGLEQAIVRDLGISPEEYEANAAAASSLSALRPQLEGLDGFVGLSLENGEGVVTVDSDSPEIDSLAASVSAHVVEVGPDDSQKPAAPVEGDAYVSLVKELLGIDGVFSVAKGAEGKVVVRTTQAAAPGNGPEALSGSDSLAQIEGKYSNIEIKSDLDNDGVEAQAASDTVGGAGYATAITDSSVSVCSIGFTAWTPAGEPAVISAGHCTDDGANHETVLTEPKNDDAYTHDPDGFPSPLTELGDFGFSQYGPTLASSPADPSKNDIDISVIDVDNADLDLLPKVAKWDTPGSNDLAATAVNVVSVGAPVLGAPVCKSGRTTGWSCSIIDGVDGWANVAGRYVYGFSAQLGSDHGDSGGSVISGSTAVGVISGGDGTFTWSSDLSNALPKTSGYTVRLFLSAPVLSAPADGATVQPGAAITGTAPAGSTVTVSIAGSEPFDVIADANGSWSFTAPGDFGPLDFTVRASSGYNESSANSYSLAVVPAAPAITAPANGAKLTAAVSVITGTGVAGATVELTGDVTDTATVDGSGNWSIPVDPALTDYDNYSVSATQTIEDQESAAATSAFSIVPVAPVILDPANGASFGAGQSPIAVSGTGIDGAVITVLVDGVAQKAAVTVADGKWTVLLDAAPAAGSHVIEAFQTIDGIDSLRASSIVTVAAADAAIVPGAESPAGPAGLANTGAPVLPIAAASIVLLGGGALLLRRRLRSALSD